MDNIKLLKDKHPQKVWTCTPWVVLLLNQDEKWDLYEVRRKRDDSPCGEIITYLDFVNTLDTQGAEFIQDVYEKIEAEYLPAIVLAAILEKLDQTYL